MKFFNSVESAQGALDQARQQLADAQGKKDKLAAAETDAIVSTEAYADWRRQIEAADLEIKRITALVQKRDAELQNETAKAAAAAQAKLEEEFERDAKTTAKLIAENLRTMTRLARETMAAIASSETKRLAAQAKRPSGAPALVSAEDRVRLKHGFLREDISEEIVPLWVVIESGRVLQENATVKVTSGDGRTGLLTHTHPSTEVELRAFRKVKYHPAKRHEWMAPLAIDLRIPAIAPGQQPGWDMQLGDSYIGDVHPVHIMNHLQNLSLAEERSAAPREVCEELVPCDEAASQRFFGRMTKAIAGGDDRETTSTSGTK